MAESEQEGNPVKADSADDDTDEESEVLEESPCGRWQKRREEVWHHWYDKFKLFKKACHLLALILVLSNI